MNATELATALFAAKADADASIATYREAIGKDADADDRARRARARSFVESKEQAPRATVAILEAMVDLETADVQKEARLADGLKRAAREAVENSRQCMSALQSLAAAERAEANLARWEPSETTTA